MRRRADAPWLRLDGVNVRVFIGSTSWRNGAGPHGRAIRLLWSMVCGLHDPRSGSESLMTDRGAAGARTVGAQTCGRPPVTSRIARAARWSPPASVGFSSILARRIDRCKTTEVMGGPGGSGAVRYGNLSGIASVPARGGDDDEGDERSGEDQADAREQSAPLAWFVPGAVRCSRVPSHGERGLGGRRDERRRR